MRVDDAKLLRDYVGRRSESAFAELSRRYVDLVYSAACRTVGDPSLAEDVVQMVFVQLMTKASTIRNGNTLPGWLYRVTRCQALNALQAERTRRRHEVEATMQAQTETKRAWEAISSELDEAMATLTAPEQDVMVLRFFQDRAWRDIGRALAVSEDTAQRRARLALNKLRAHLARKGIAVTAGVIGAAVSANAVRAAPTGLASAVASAVQAQGAASLGASAALKTLFAGKVATICVGLALVAAVAVPVTITQTHKAKTAAVQAGLSQGQVLHFAFDWDEGNDVTDSSGSNNHGRAIGARWVSDDERGGVFQFASPNQYIRVPDSDSLDPRRITLAAWIKTKRQDGAWRRIFGKSWDRGYAMSIGGDWEPKGFHGKVVTEIAMNSNKSTGITFSDATLTDGRWHHLVTTYDGAQQCTYIDGALQETVARWVGEIPSNSFDLTLGDNLIDPEPEYRAVGTSFDGLMDEAMIWDRALSSEEVDVLYRSQR